MADVKVEFMFNTVLTQKEFSVMTRALAGHAMKEEDRALATDLNIRLLRLRVNQLREYTSQSTRALENAIEEQETLNKESQNG